MNRITINGQTITCSGSNIIVDNGKIIVDGQTINKCTDKNIKVVIEGNIDSLDCGGFVEVHGNVDDINCSGSCNITGDVEGDVSVAGSVTCGNVQQVEACSVESN